VAIDRLSGGLTPADGSDPRTFPAIFNVAADEIERIDDDVTAVEQRVTTAEGDIVAVEGRVTTAEGDIGQLQTDVGDNAVAIAQNVSDIGDLQGDLSAVESILSDGLAFVGTRYFTGDGDFEKDDPFDDGNPAGIEVRAIRVKVQAAGGGGGGAGPTNESHGGGGGGGAYSEKFITDIDGLSSSVSVTVGSGGAAGAAGENAGSAGGSSSFGSEVVCGGGGGGQPATGSFVANNGGTVTTAGDFSISGGGGVGRGLSNTPVGTGVGGNAFLGFTAGTRLIIGSFPGTDVSTSGFGAGGAAGRRGPAGTNRAGAPGVDGIVIVEVFA
jgi:hypothetical protein